MPELPRKGPKKPKATLITFMVLVLAGILYLGWNYHAGNLPWQQAGQELEPKVKWLEGKTGEEDTGTVAPAGEDQAKLHLALGEDSSPATPQNECLQTTDKIFLFFEHLDRQGYIREFGLQGSSLEHFTNIIKKLMANPPVVVRETDDLFAILNNMAHFFRVLGPKDILFIKDVLIHEREIIEPTMALFYKWSEIEPTCPGTGLDIELPLAGLYEYAGYFINTLGGQSYLFRRQPYLRLLVRYYSVLIIDRANSIDANRYGIDIRYTLDSLISEINGNENLIDKEKYLQNLAKLQDKYQVKYGAN